MAKVYTAGVLTDVAAIDVYDKTKTSHFGRSVLKTLPAPYDDAPVLGGPLPNFIDVFTDTLGTFLPGLMYLTANNRLFILLATPVTGITNQIAMYSFNVLTGAYSYVGKIAFPVAAATVVGKGFKVDDTNTSNIKIFFGYTSTSVTSGGVMMLNKITLASFVPSVTQYYTAIANDQAGCYNLQMPLEFAGGTLLTALTGVSLPGTLSANSAINTKAYIHNGISATQGYYVFDYATAPAIMTMTVSTATSANSTGANTTFTMTGNTLAVNDQVVITANAPTGYTLTSPTTVQTVYFVVATNFISGSTFSLALTLGGAIVNGSTAVTSTFVRAQGCCTNLFIAKTPNLPTLGAGTTLLTNSENFCVPSSAANSGLECLFIATTTNFHEVKISDLYEIRTGTTSTSTVVTSLGSTTGLSIGNTVFGGGVQALTTIASIDSSTQVTLSLATTTSATASLTFGKSAPLLTINVLGTGLDYVTPVPVSASFDTTLNRVIYPTNVVMCTLIKQWVNSSVESTIGGTGNNWYETLTSIAQLLLSGVLTSFHADQGWLFFSNGSSTGQRGIIFCDLRTDDQYGFTYVITPVLPTPGLQTLTGLATVEQLRAFDRNTKVQYRSYATLADAGFSTESGGWTTVERDANLNVALSGFTQFRLSSVLPSPGLIHIPSQLQELFYVTELLAEVSDYWDFSWNDSTSAIPTKIGFSLVTAYTSGTVPRMKLICYDTSGTIVALKDTVTDIANFSYSTNSGVSFTPLGTIPNTVNTRVQFTFTTPPGVDVRIAWLEYV